MIEQHKPYTEGWITITKAFPPPKRWDYKPQRLGEPVEEDWLADGYATMAIFASRPQAQGTSEEVLGCMWCWADLDVYNAEGVTKAETVKVLQEWKFPPTLIIDSGGGLYGWWRLDSLCKDRDAVEGVNRYLASVFAPYGADDGVWSWSHVFRYPGTVNQKLEEDRPVTILDSIDRNYSIDELPKLAQVLNGNGYSGSINFEPLAVNWREHLQANNPNLYEKIVNGVVEGSRTKGDGYVDRSSVLQSVLCTLLKRPFVWTPGQLLTLQFEEDLAISEKVYEKNQQSRRKFAEHNIRRAQEWVKKLNLLPTEDTKELFLEKKFIQLRAANAFLNYKKIGRVRNKLVYFDDKRWVDVDADYYVERILVDTLGDRYTSSYADEVKRELMALAPVLEDAGEDFIALQNKIVNLRTFEARDHTPDVYLATSLPVIYAEPTKSALAEIDFYHEAWFGPDLDVWWEFAGHCLTREVLANGFLVLYGAAKTGKSQPVILLESVLGLGNFSSLDLPEFALGNFVLSRLRNKLANLKSESSSEIDLTLPTGIIKSVSGGEFIETQEKYKDSEGTRVTCPCIFCMNHLVRVKKDDEGFYRRLFAIPFDGKRVWDTNDKGFVPDVGRWLGSRPEIRTAYFYRALEGLARLRANRAYTETDNIREARGDMRFNSDSVLRYWTTKVELDPEARENASFLFHDYQQSTRRDGNSALSKGSFLSRTKELMLIGLVPSYEKKAGVDTRFKKNSETWFGCRIKETSVSSMTFHTDKGFTVVDSKSKGA